MWDWKRNRKLLPAHFPPEPDELFSSWLVRLATVHCIKLHNFSQHIFGHRRIWNRDIDKSADTFHIEKLTEYTGKSFKTIYNSTLRFYEGKVYEKHNPNGITRWILPIGVFSQTRKRFGLQMCPACLAEDETPYYRKLWRLAWVTICIKHCVELLDRCPGCRSPIMFYRSEMGYRFAFFPQSMTVCPVCNTDWTSNQVIKELIKAEPDVIRFQRKLEDAVNDNWIFLEIADSKNSKLISNPVNGEWIHSISFFDGLKHLLWNLSVAKKTEEFRLEAGRQSGLPLCNTIDSDCKKPAFSFEYLSVSERAKTLRIAAWVLDDWSNRIIDVAKLSGTFISALHDYRKPLPFWYWLPLYEHLTKYGYLANEEEILSAVDVLSRQNGFVMVKNLTKILGQDFLSKKDDRFKIKLYERMIKLNAEGERKRKADVHDEAKHIRNNRKNGISKTRAKLNSQKYLREHKKPPKQFNKVQSLLSVKLYSAKRRERLKMAKRMECEQNATLISKEFGVSPGIIKKWYRRYKEGGAQNLDDRPRKPKTIPHQKVFKKQEEWIRKLHSEGLELSQIRDELEIRYEFKMTEGGVYNVLKRLNLPLPCSSKNKFHYRNRRRAASRRHLPHKKIFEKQEKWILELRNKGLSYVKIKDELKIKHNFEIGIWSIRNVIKQTE